MGDAGGTFLRGQLAHRRNRLEAAISRFGQTDSLVELLQEVDSALQRMDKGTYGLCATCHDPIETDRLMADPLVCFCVDHLTSEQQRALEQDLELAARIQGAMLPERHVAAGGWEIDYNYEPAGPVSGDFCDLLTSAADGETLFFLLGDVAGKGVAASMLMAHLHAIFRSLVAVGLPVTELAERANRLFSETTMATFFATLVIGKAAPSGDVEICNAGHCAPLCSRDGEVVEIEATGLPLGMFSTVQYEAKHLRLEKGDGLFLYTDGLVEARDAAGAEYSEERLRRFLASNHTLPPEALVTACREDLKSFLSGTTKTDDLTLMAIRRVH
jgi:sigma-B regulation protein RsbU (phosphoserine phosphatase)